MATAIAFVV